MNARRAPTAPTRPKPAQTKPRPAINAFTIKFDRRVNRVITEAHLSPAYDPGNPPDPIPNHVKTQALWDTGATGSVITSGMVKALGVSPAGLVNVNHAGGASQSHTYVVNLVLPNRVGIPGVRVTECPDIADGFGVIIGMDIIGLGDLAITNSADKTLMTFRLPTSGGIDFVKEAERQAFAGVGRNDPCPCGRTDSNGRPLKYKKCHGRA